MMPVPVGRMLVTFQKGGAMLTSITNRFNTFLLVLLAMMAASIIAILASRAGAGPLDPPGPPSSSLPQVEPRMPIPPVGWNGTFPITISQSGSYFLTENLTDSTATTNGIDITASHVVLDLNGFTLAATPGVFWGIYAPNTLTGVTVRNGKITGWAVGGELESSTTTVEDVTADSNVFGITVGSGSTVRRVDAEANSNIGIQIMDTTSLFRGGVIEDSIASKNGNGGVAVDANNVTVRNCSIERNTGDGVTIANAADVVQDNSIVGNSAYGVILVSGAATNHDSVVHNVFHGNTLGPVTDGGTSDVIGPMDTNGTSSQPWSNLSY
jgi:hypothetical protein